MCSLRLEDRRRIAGVTPQGGEPLPLRLQVPLLADLAHHSPPRAPIALRAAQRRGLNPGLNPPICCPNHDLGGAPALRGVSTWPFWRTVFSSARHTTFSAGRTERRASKAWIRCERWSASQISHGKRWKKPCAGWTPPRASMSAKVRSGAKGGAQVDRSFAQSRYKGRQSGHFCLHKVSTFVPCAKLMILRRKLQNGPAHQWGKVPDGRETANPQQSRRAKVQDPANKTVRGA